MINTNNAITRGANFVTESFEMCLKPLAIFLDLLKTLDTVAHQIVLHKLELAGIRGKAFEVFRSYLQNITQEGRIRQTLSNVETVEFGVPQGTVLGPVLFFCNVNSIFLNVNLAKIICFADNTAILVRGESGKTAQIR